MESHLEGLQTTDITSILNSLTHAVKQGVTYQESINKLSTHPEDKSESLS